MLTQQAQLLAQQERLPSLEAEVKHLRLLLAQLRRLRFGRKSELRIVRCDGQGIFDSQTHYLIL
jgi:hypothetical protein